MAEGNGYSPEHAIAPEQAKKDFQAIMTRRTFTIGAALAPLAYVLGRRSRNKESPATDLHNSSIQQNVTDRLSPSIPSTQAKGEVNSELPSESDSITIANQSGRPGEINDAELSRVEALSGVNEQLNDILKCIPGSEERHNKEEAYLVKARTLDEINDGFRVCANLNVRNGLREKRYQLRLSGTESRLNQLTSEQLSWAKQRKIHPEVLGTSIDVEKRARQVLQTIREHNPGKYKHIDDISLVMMNVGGMAGLQTIETAGFQGIGAGIAIDEVNENSAYFKTDKQAVKELATALSNDTKLHYVAENIPGSIDTEKKGNSSGGAIGPQIMPRNLMNLYTEAKLSGYILNPFDVEDSMILSYMYLMDHGYKRGDEDAYGEAIREWNPLVNEILFVKESAESYWTAFIHPNLG